MVSSELRRTTQRYEGRFFGRRVNCEQVPLLPAWAVARVVDDPRRIPYLLVWRSRSDGTVQEAVRVASYSEPGNPFVGTGWVEIKRTDETRMFIRTVPYPLPRGGKVGLLVCPDCTIPRRALYSWEPGGQFTTSVVRSTWGCRKCNMLRYSSEGGALVHRSRGTLFQMIEAAYGPCRSPRPEPWYPEIFTSPREAMEAGLATLK